MASLNNKKLFKNKTKRLKKKRVKKTLYSSQSGNFVSLKGGFSQNPVVINLIYYIPPPPPTNLLPPPPPPNLLPPPPPPNLLPPPLPTNLLQTQLTQILNKLDTELYDLVYVSIGSKFNETWYIKNKILSNSAYQLVPFFLTTISKRRVLCIAIDQFNESNNDIRKSIVNINENYDSADINNIDFYILNTINIRDATNNDSMKQAEYTGNIIATLSEKLQSKEFNPEKYMVCNYVKFKNPSEIEEKIKNEIKEKVKNALINYNYENSYYDWIGYTDSMFFDYISNKIDSVAHGLLKYKYTDEPYSSPIIEIINNNINQNRFSHYYPIKRPIVEFDIYNYDINKIIPKTNDFVYSLGEIIEGIQNHIKS